MRLIAKKPCSFEGKKFYIGDEIPVEFVANPKAQEKMGVLTIAGDGGTIPPEELQNYTQQVGDVKFSIPVHADEGDLSLEVTNDELVTYFDIQQIGVKDTEDKQKIADAIQKVESLDLLIMLDALDGRKYVKELAEARANEINAENQDENQDGDNVSENEE